jgi:AraC family transcriptional regulator of adaptative response/methylated-DNA-[protein]-cysteine methyltransferase
MNDFERVARIIRYLDERHSTQPPLSTLAREARLSPFHFHRLFSAWAGVTPKNFLQCLTFAHARQLLQRGESVLDTAFETGLSGPGRLHDLCVRLEAASPGEIKSGGAGWTISAGFGASPFGDVLIAQSPRGICHLSFVDGGRKAAWKEMTQLWPNARWRRDDSTAGRFLGHLFDSSLNGARRRTLTAFVKGTPFQVRVWRALLRVPSGQLTTYGRLASAMGMPSAARAVGSAVGRNELSWLIPCHRVIRQTGVVGDYRWGKERKRLMIAWESARAPLAHREPSPIHITHSL